MTFHNPEGDCHDRDADAVVPLLRGRFPLVRSVVDFGCNRGAYLAAFRRFAVLDVLGVDGDNMLPRLAIPSENFVAADLTVPMNLSRRFDMALCIETAEHLPEKAADTLLDTLARHSDLIVFSAAKPGQGGFGHLNEQPDLYWLTKFAERGYSPDVSIRDALPRAASVWLHTNLAVLRNNR